MKKGRIKFQTHDLNIFKTGCDAQTSLLMFW